MNANGTLNLLEAARDRPAVTFVYMSTNKVYGDLPNELPLIETETRLELPADLMVQEYGRYCGMPTVCFRGGCLTGPAHAGAKLHGFLSHRVRCAASGEPYAVLGYGGKQVRDNVHCADVVDAFHANPCPAAVYNLGGGRAGNCSMLEAIEITERVCGRRWTGRLPTRIGSVITAGGSVTSRSSSATTPPGRSPAGSTI